MRNWPERITKLKKIHNLRDKRNPEFQEDGTKKMK